GSGKVGWSGRGGAAGVVLAGNGRGGGGPRRCGGGLGGHVDSGAMAHVSPSSPRRRRTGTRAPSPAAMAASTVQPRPRGRGSLATPLAVRRAVCFARVSAGLRAPDADHGPVLLLAVASRVVGPSAMTAIVSATAAGQRRH